MQNSSDIKSLYTTIIILQCAIGILFLGIGIVQQFVRPSLTQNNLNAELSSIEADLANSQNAVNNAFSNSGFGNSFYQTSNEQAALIERQTELQQNLNTLQQTDIINSHAIYYYIASLVTLLSIIPVVLLKKNSTN